MSRWSTTTDRQQMSTSPYYPCLNNTNTQLAVETRNTVREGQLACRAALRSSSTNSPRRSANNWSFPNPPANTDCSQIADPCQFNYDMSRTRAAATRTRSSPCGPIQRTVASRRLAARRATSLGSARPTSSSDTREIPDPSRGFASGPAVAHLTETSRFTVSPSTTTTTWNGTPTTPASGRGRRAGRSPWRATSTRTG